MATYYQLSENLGRISRPLLKQLFMANRTCREMLMNDDERRFYNSLPAKVTIYRGMTKKERRARDYGISWTLDKARAEFFAFNYIRNHAFANEPKCVVKLVVPKTRIIAYWDGRNEQEIIYI